MNMTSFEIVSPDLPAAGEAEAAPGTVLTFYQIFGLFRAFLGQREASAWPVASLNLVQGLDSASMHRFVVARGGLLEAASLADPARGELPVFYDYEPEWKGIEPTNVVYRFEDAFCFAFQQVDYGGGRGERVLVAAPDVDRLRRLYAEIDRYCIRTQRESEEIQMLGGPDVAIDRTLTWDDLILPEPLKQDVRANLELFLRGRALFDSMRLPYKRGFLFAGPPGNGKTLLCRVLAAQARIPCLVLLTAKQCRYDPIAVMFQRARRLAPCMMVFEDLDTLLEGDGRLSFFLNQLDGFSSNDGLLVVATTNHPEAIDEAILKRPSRFDRVWRVENPALPCRRAYLGRLFAGHLSEAELDECAEETDGFSCAFLKEAYISAAQSALFATAEQNGAPARIGRGQVTAGIELLRGQLEGAAREFRAGKPCGFGEP